MKPRKILILFVCFIAALSISTYVIMAHTGASRLLARRALADFIHGNFELSDATFDPTTGRATLTDFQLSHPQSGREPLLLVEHVAVGINTNPLGQESRVRHVDIRNLQLNLDLVRDKTLDLDQIIRSPQSEGKSSAAYPTISISHSRVILRFAKEAKPLDFSAVDLALFPEEPGSTRMILSGTMRSREGYVLAVSGSADLDKRIFRARMTTTDVELIPKLARDYSPSLADYLQSARFSGQASKISFWIEYPGGAEGQITAGVTADVTQLTCAIPELPYPLHSAQGSVAASTTNNGAVQFQLRDDVGERSLDIRGDFLECASGSPQATVRISGKNIEVDETLARALHEQPRGRQVWDAFDPTAGHVDVEIQIDNEQGLKKPQLSLDLTLRGVRTSFHGFSSQNLQRKIGFPYPIEMEGKVQLRPGRLHLHDLKATRRDGARMTIRGSVVGSAPETPGVSLEIAAENVLFSEDLQNALAAFSPAGHTVYRDYQPEGRINLNAKLNCPKGSSETSYDIVIRPQTCSASFSEFPYRIHDLQGLVRITDSGSTVDLKGHHAETTVSMKSRLAAAPNSNTLRNEIWLEAKGIPLDKDIRLATTKLGLDKIWATLAPTGQADCRMTMWQVQGDEAPHYDLSIDFRNGTARFDRFPLPIRDLHGQIAIHGNPTMWRIDIGMLRGGIENGPNSKPASILVNGSIIKEGDRRSEDLTAIAQGLELNSRLAKELDHGDLFGQEAWDVLAPSGSVDIVILDRKRMEDPEAELRLRLRLVDVTSRASILPAPATRLMGEVTVEDGKAKFSEITGFLGEAEVICRSGSIKHEGGFSEIKATINAENLPVDDKLGNLMTGPMRSVYLDRKMQGAVAIKNLEFAYRFPDEGKDFEVNIQGELIAKNLSMDLAVPITNLNGYWKDIRAHFTPAGGPVTGRLDDVSCTVLGHHAGSIFADFRADPGKISFVYHI